MLTWYGFLFLNIGLAALVLHAVLRPVARVLAGRPFAWRAQGVDGFTLLVLLLLPLGLFLWQRENASLPLRWQALTLASFVVLAWWRSVGALSQLGIRQSLRRFVFAGVILPIALFGSVAMVVGVMRLGMWITLTPYREGADLIWLILVPLLIAYVFVIRRLTRWVLDGAEPLGLPKDHDVVTAEVVGPRPEPAVHADD